MGLDRRNFLKTLGVVGTTLAVGKGFSATKEKKNDIEFRGILYRRICKSYLRLHFFITQLFLGGVFCTNFLRNLYSYQDLFGIY